MPSAVRPLSVPAPLRSGIDAWYDGVDSGRAVPILLVLFVLVWTAFQIISYASIDLHPDLVEVFAWSRHPAAGYYKHPPLGGWIVAAWFAVFPVADWSFHLLAMVNAAVALFAVDLIARRYLAGDKRVLVLLLLLLTPFYQFHGQRFASNQTLLSTWPIATYCFLRAFETRGVAWSLAAGAAAALAMLGKYYSIYLIGGLVIAALAHPKRWDYLRSPAPWLSVLAGFAILAPHLYWLASTGGQPITYAMSTHGHLPVAAVLKTCVSYVLGAVGYIVLPIVVYAVAVRPDRRALAAAAWPDDPDRRMLVLLLVLPLALPIVTAPLLQVGLTSLWTMQAWFLLPIVLLAPPEVTLTRHAAVHVAAFVLAITTALLLLAAPALAWINHVNGTKEGRAYYRAVSEELTRQWRRREQRPLTIVTGNLDLGSAITFYSADHPDSAPVYDWPASPWITPERRARRAGRRCAGTTTWTKTKLASRRPSGMHATTRTRSASAMKLRCRSSAGRRRPRGLCSCCSRPRPEPAPNARAR